MSAAVAAEHPLECASCHRPAFFELVVDGESFLLCQGCVFPEDRAAVRLLHDSLDEAFDFGPEWTPAPAGGNAARGHATPDGDHR